MQKYTAPLGAAYLNPCRGLNVGLADLRDFLVPHLEGERGQLVREFVRHRTRKPLAVAVPDLVEHIRPRRKRFGLQTQGTLESRGVNARLCGERIDTLRKLLQNRRVGVAGRLGDKTHFRSHDPNYLSHAIACN